MHVCGCMQVCGSVVVLIELFVLAVGDGKMVEVFGSWPCGWVWVHLLTSTAFLEVHVQPCAVCLQQTWDLALTSNGQDHW